MHTYSCEENVRDRAMRAHGVKKMSTNAMQRFAQRRQPDRMRNMLRISCKRMRGPSCALRIHARRTSGLLETRKEKRREDAIRAAFYVLIRNNG
jgi:hypothetical protein